MSITNLKLDESAKLEFDVLITGADGIPSSRFVIEGKNYSVSFPCRQVNEGVEVEITGLKNMFPAGEYPVRLEVVLENKIYTPMQDTISLEPVVEINTKTKPAAQVKESVKVMGKINVTKKPMFNESVKLQTETALTIAEALKYTPSMSMSPSSIIESAVKSVEQISDEEYVLIEKMLSGAESVGIQFDKNAMLSLVESKKIVKYEEVKDTSDYKLSSSGKKVKAHKIVFNKGEEEPHQSEEVDIKEDEIVEEKPNDFAKFVSRHGKKVTEDVDQMSEEQLIEVLKKTDPAGKWISDFVHSKNPKFAGKTRKERMKMALAAHYSAQRNEQTTPGKTNESSLAKSLVRKLLNK